MKTNCAQTFFIPTRRSRSATHDVYLCSGYVGYGSTTLPPKNHVPVCPLHLPPLPQSLQQTVCILFRSSLFRTAFVFFWPKMRAKEKTAIHVQTTMRSTETRVIPSTATAFERVISYAGVGVVGRAVTEIMAVPATLFQTVPRKFGKQSKSVVVYADARKQTPCFFHSGKSLCGSLAALYVNRGM